MNSEKMEENISSYILYEKNLIRGLIHVDTDEDMKQQREELRKAEKQEKLLMLRDRDNAVAAEVLRAILNVDAGTANGAAAGAIYTDPNRIVQGWPKL